MTKEERKKAISNLTQHWVSGAADDEDIVIRRIAFHLNEYIGEELVELERYEGVMKEWKRAIKSLHNR
jgi:hypothetical protein